MGRRSSRLRTAHRSIAALAAFAIGTGIAQAAPRPVAEGGVILTYRNTASPDAATETWYVRGDAIRIDTPAGGTPGPVVHRYVWPGQRVSFVTWEADGRISALEIGDDATAARPSITQRRFTGAVETHLGRSCRTWETTPSAVVDLHAAWSGCRTADGIDLWQSRSGGRIEAVGIRHGAVPVRDVRPPLHMLDPLRWLPVERGARHDRDYRVDLGTESARSSPDIHVRSGTSTAWFLRYQRDTWFRLTDDRTGFHLRYRDDYKAGRRLRMVAYSAPVASPIPLWLEGVNQPGETILGEECRWPPPPGTPGTPGAPPRSIISDGGSDNCTTRDGLPLVLRRNGYRMRGRREASRLDRRPQPRAALMLAPAIATAAFWGLTPETP